jgi:hypothetical protein
LDVQGFFALAARSDVELDALALFEGAVAVTLDGGEVHEDVVSALSRDETEALLAVEPFHGACGQGVLTICSVVLVSLRNTETKNSPEGEDSIRMEQRAVTFKCKIRTVLDGAA